MSSYPVQMQFGDSSSNGSRDTYTAAKPSNAAFSNVDNFLPEVRSDVMSGVVVDPTDVNIPVKLGDSRSNRSRDIQHKTIMLWYRFVERQNV